MKMNGKCVIMVLFTAVLLFAPLFGASMAKAANAPGQLVEYVFKTELTGVDAVYNNSDGQTVIIGFDTSSTVHVIPSAVNSAIPPELGVTVGASQARIRFPDGVYLNRNTPYQRATMEGELIIGAMAVHFKGTVVIRWVQELNNTADMGDHTTAGTYSGIRWTDFSAGITRIEGALSDWTGHIVGTRFLVNIDPDMNIKVESFYQKGLVILRLMRFDAP